MQNATDPTICFFLPRLPLHCTVLSLHIPSCFFHQDAFHLGFIRLHFQKHSLNVPAVGFHKMHVNALIHEKDKIDSEIQMRNTRAL